MAASYSDHGSFCDPAFGELDVIKVRKMWQMLCARGRDLKVDFQIHDHSPDSATVLWQAEYTFSQTKRKVRNSVLTNMTVKDGKIIRHVDQFDFFKWAQQAFGLPMAMVILLPPVKKALMVKFRQALDRYEGT